MSATENNGEQGAISKRKRPQSLWGCGCRMISAVRLPRRADTYEVSGSRSLQVIFSDSS